MYNAYNTIMCNLCKNINIYIILLNYATHMHEYGFSFPIEDKKFAK